MIFGDKNSFAVEAELDEDDGGTWLYGRICYWIGGMQIGDYDDVTILSDALHDMIWLVHDCGKRDGDVLCTMTAEAAFCAIDALLYGSGDCDSGVESIQLGTPARFNIRIGVDVFYGWKVYLLECGDTATVLLKKAGACEVQVITIPVGAFDRAIKAAYQWLDEIPNRETAHGDV